MAKEKLKLFKDGNRGGNGRGVNDAKYPLMTLVLDVSTQWNSACGMLIKMLKHKDSMITFII